MVREFCNWLAATYLSQLLASLSWFVPVVQTIHILGIAAVMITMGMLNFKLIGWTHAGPSFSELIEHFMPWTWKALGALLVTGVLLTIAEPSRELMKDAFRLKMAMVAVLAILLAVFRASVRSDPEYWSSSRRSRWIAGAIGLGTLVLCVAIATAGRLIAYT